jgi:DNA-binding NarL/FixJ family response regulator
MIRMIIVDDLLEYLEILKNTLELDREIKVVGAATNGYEALTLCEVKAPDMVLMDYIMPVCDGGWGTMLIKERFPQIKVLIMTGFGNKNDLMKALEYGADRYLMKLVETPKLWDAVKNAMNGVTTIDPEIFIP